MRIATTLSLLALALSAPISGQAPASPKTALASNSPAPYVVAPNFSSAPVTWKTEFGSVTYLPTCPVDLQVRQRPGSHTLQVNKDGSLSDSFAARLHMTLLDLRPDKTAQQMVKATVTVSGLNGRDHILGLYGGDEERYRITRTLTVPLNGSERELAAELRLPGFTAATWVELNSITYDDGEVQTFTAPTRCGARPDPLMLISPR